MIHIHISSVVLLASGQSHDYVLVSDVTMEMSSAKYRPFCPSIQGCTMISQWHLLMYRRNRTQRRAYKNHVEQGSSTGARTHRYDYEDLGPKIFSRLCIPPYQEPLLLLQRWTKQTNLWYGCAITFTWNDGMSCSSMIKLERRFSYLISPWAPFTNMVYLQSQEGGVITSILKCEMKLLTHS